MTIDEERHVAELAKLKAEIELIEAQNRKMRAELDSAELERSKLRAETRKLEEEPGYIKAQTRKLYLEMGWYPVVIGAALFAGGGAAVIGLVKLWEVLKLQL